MTTKPWLIFAAVALLALGATPCVSAETKSIRIVTQSFAPLQWDNDGTPDGYVAQYISAVMERVKKRIPLKTASIEFMPWKRAMLTAERVPNVLLFSLSRTPKREEQFLWLGEVSPYGQYLYQLRSNPEIAADTVADLKGADVRIGVQDGGNTHAYLREAGLETSGQLVPITDYRQGIEMLYLGRIDLLPLTGFLAEASACRQGYDGDQLRPVVYIEDLAKPLWAVFSRGTDIQLVEAFRDEMAALKESGYLQEQMRRHRENWQSRACAG
ncbi:substrate-binding periplasmic protein [Roseibium sp.]|uniref:substrate-binding periplasmic protein n=1 Tax=Roseibium sp. TaxID=1936156 RepID=UPI003BA8482C